MNFLILLFWIIYYCANSFGDGDPVGWISHEGYYYYYSETSNLPSQGVARTNCQSMAADILCIADKKEQWFINTTISTGYIIGLKTDKVGSTAREDWYWLDETAYDVNVWHNWENNEPNENANKCGRLLNTGFWRDQYCDHGGYQHICKKEGINECSSDPCLNNGVCIDAVNSYTCDCNDTGYDGNRCENDIDECANGDLVCFFNSTCENTLGSAVCDCVPGTTGKNCETDINECEPDPCINGTCTDFLNGYHCECYPGFEGTECQTDINECELEELVCFYNSTCINIPGSAYCSCVIGTTGNNCATDINECVSDPCINGHCTDVLGGFYCECVAGYEGIVCEADIDECSSPIHECVNGTCFNIEGSYWCNCTEGFFGKTCNETSFEIEQEENDLYALEVAFYASLAICIAINSSFATVVIYYYGSDRRKKAENEELAEYCNVQGRPEQNDSNENYQATKCI